MRFQASGSGLRGAALALGVALSAGHLGCGYHRLDAQPHAAPWLHKGDTVRLGAFVNRTPRLGIEDRLSKAMEYRIVAASPWKLVPADQPSRWILQGTLEKYETRPLGLSLGSGNDKRSAGAASRVEVLLVASVDLLDGQTGAVVLSRRGLTFSNQYRVDENFASFDNREVQVFSNLSDDFAESMLTQLLEASE